LLSTAHNAKYFRFRQSEMQNLLHCTSGDAKSLGFHWPRWVWFMHDPSLDRRSLPSRPDWAANGGGKMGTQFLGLETGTPLSDTPHRKAGYKLQKHNSGWEYLLPRTFTNPKAAAIYGCQTYARYDFNMFAMAQRNSFFSWN
jgi:hypothetical protein